LPLSKFELILKDNYRKVAIPTDDALLVAKEKERNKSNSECFGIWKTAIFLLDHPAFFKDQRGKCSSMYAGFIHIPFLQPYTSTLIEVCPW